MCRRKRDSPGRDVSSGLDYRDRLLHNAPVPAEAGEANASVRSLEIHSEESRSQLTVIVQLKLIRLIKLQPKGS